MRLVYLTPFVREALELPLPERKGLSKLLGIAEDLGFAELLNHGGIRLEKLVRRMDPKTGKPLYSLRATRGARVIALVDGDALVLLHVEADHDKAYR